MNEKYEKIRYRLVFNRSRRLNRRGEGLVQIECQQGVRRIYFSTKVYIEPCYWCDGMVVDHELATDLNVILRRQRIDIERVELDFMMRDIRVTLPMLREAVKSKTAPSAKLTDFGRNVISQSDRRDVTKANYRTLLNDIDRFRRGIRVDGDIQKLEKLTKLSDRETIVRDAFLFCCFTGLRWSDFLALEPSCFKNGWIRITMQKTNLPVSIPYTRLFEGRAQKLLERYDGDIRKMNSRLPANSQVNSTIRDLLRKACINVDFRVTFHTSRHTFASLLLEEGVPVTTVQRMLGHTKVQTTQIYAEVTERTIEKDISRQAGKSSKRKRRHS